MTTKKIIPSTLVITTISLLTSGLCHAAVYTVANSSFEQDVTAVFTSGIPTGWNGSSQSESGVQTSTATSMTGVTGDQTCYINGNNSVWQVSLTTLVLGQTYTLTADVGSRASFSSSGFQLKMFRNGLQLSDVIATTGTIDPADDNVMREYSLTFENNIYDGGSLHIMLSNLPSGNQTNFDNVRLTSVPEASTLAMGTLAMLPLLRRRRL